mmetsp:Transcript_57098/g.66717  ORF Transcript_57098/g.66717 Transcript_57098/m.66717 type:complete len:197 (+) Transcript_57098:578-1168(+)
MEKDLLCKKCEENKKKHATIYQQLLDIFERIKDTKVLMESIHALDTQLNEVLNMAVAQSCPKFKHLGQTMTLITRVSIVALVRNCGYEGLYQIIMDKMGIIQETNSICHAFIVKHDQARTRKRAREATAEYKRVRKLAIEAMKRESVLEARIGNNDYGAGIAFDLSDVEDDKQAASQKKKKEPKFCKWYDKTTKRG